MKHTSEIVNIESLTNDGLGQFLVIASHLHMFQRSNGVEMVTQLGTGNSETVFKQMHLNKNGYNQL